MNEPTTQELLSFLYILYGGSWLWDANEELFWCVSNPERRFTRTYVESLRSKHRVHMNATEKKPKEPASEQTVTVTNPRPCWTFKMPEATQAKHFDEGKTRYDLIPVGALTPVACVFDEGAIKYGEGNWQKGMPWSKLYASTLRHLFRWKSGEDFDSESDLYHLAHAVANLMMLLEYADTHPELDDREKNP